MVYKRSCCYFRYAHPQVTVALRIASMQTIVDIRTMSSLHRYTSPKIQCKIISALCILVNWFGFNCLNPESLFCWNGFHKKLLNSTHDRQGVHSVAYRDSITGCWPLFCLCSNYTVVVTYKQVKTASLIYSFSGRCSIAKFEFLFKEYRTQTPKFSMGYPPTFEC